MKKSYLLAMALAAMVSCTSDEFVGDNGSPNGVNGNGGESSISFNLNIPNVTRATEVGGADAATALSEQFIIWGEKNETNDGVAATAGNLVFKNYIVRWTDNSAYTTTSNTKNWEYVGFKFDDSSVSPSTENYSTNVTPNTKGESVNAPDQTIKYWDYSASNYTFTAVSALPADITNGKVVIKKNTSGNTVYDKGYEIAVKSGATLDNIFVADRNQPTTGTGTDREATNAYGGNVTMKFRNFMSKIRFGLYETIPGYKVNITNVEYNNTGSTSTTKFGVDGKFLTAGANTIFTVTYETGASPNKAIVDVKDGSTPNDQGYLETAQSVEGSPILSTSSSSPVSTIVTSPTYDKTDGAYTTILPYTSNTTNMKVKFDFILTSEDTGETITVSDATAEIPAAYCQWKSNYAYTYLLKINDNTNGQIGGVTGLYPITFDAVSITDENGKAEYITTVSEPSITTFGVKNGKYTTGKDEYETGTDIYVTILDNSSVADPILGTNVNVYSVSTSDANFPVTEASLAEAIAETGGSAGEKITYTLKNNDSSTSFTAVPAKVTSVPGEDGVNKTINALKLSGVTTAGTYAVEYINGKASTPAAATDVSDGTWFTDVQCTTEATGTADGSTTYYKREKKTYKIIKVVAGS